MIFGTPNLINLIVMKTRLNDIQFKTNTVQPQHSKVDTQRHSQLFQVEVWDSSVLMDVYRLLMKDCSVSKFLIVDSKST